MVDSRRSILAELRPEWDLSYGFDRNLGSSLRSDFFCAICLFRWSSLQSFPHDAQLTDSILQA
jgi:hypothetical protein